MTFSIFYNVLTPVFYLTFTPQLTEFLSKHVFSSAETCPLPRRSSCNVIFFSHNVYKRHGK